MVAENVHRVLTQPHQVEQYYRDSHKHVKAKNNNSGWLFGEVLGECVGLVSLQVWRNQRKLLDKPFSRLEAMLYTQSMLSQARIFINGLEIGEQRTIDPAVDLQFYPFMVVANMLFGQLDKLQMDALLELAPMREELFKEVIRGGINRLAIAQYVPWSGVPLLLNFQKHWQVFVEKAYHKASIESPGAPIVSLWQAMLDGNISKREVSLAISLPLGIRAVAVDDFAGKAHQRTHLTGGQESQMKHAATNDSSAENLIVVLTASSIGLSDT